ncbi:hypothetical protein [Secundilactobacillus kimchicus]|uniref:Phage protein n=1 Tax=Secundilactobacillus kimchicus JCM 15530 TaxID=1302272 RepID=A0A0R1I0C4_9LACO|nr:hypothetical protein [Secundilactobacillus kimchicus]KRK49178.1 hypothetical protein FC96_GL000099 [Secundilactobacillus kimchicus JCM 15530]MBT9672723.1 hypothetical protein [Secundilactobacillus kimchicus]
MQTKDQMSEPDFQRLVQIALTDLAIRRTVAENDMADVNEEMRSLEKDDKLDRLDAQIRAIQSDYDHYRQFLDPEFKMDVTAPYNE